MIMEVEKYFRIVNVCSVTNVLHLDYMTKFPPNIEQTFY